MLQCVSVILWPHLAVQRHNASVRRSQLDPERLQSLTETVINAYMVSGIDRS